MVHAFTQLNRGRIILTKNLANEIEVKEEDSLFIFSDEIKKHGKVLIIKKVKGEDITKLKKDE